MVVVRFAPSPTGFLHLGSARTALFNWLCARHTGGKFLLRIEDTDLVRSDKKFLDEILSDLKWMGLDWDGEPVFQSHRFDIYRSEAAKLVEAGKGYKEGEAMIFRVEKGKAIEIDDMVHGKITFNTDEIKDQVMIKSDGSPAYNFSCVVDDSALGITHIIRGDDHLSNTPKQILFYEALGKVCPKFAHIPLVMGQDGAKLSKRHGAVSVEEYKKEGFLPEALANYLILLGWSAKDDREFIPLAEAVKIFEVEDMKDVQVRFDMQKLRWLNGEYIVKTETKKLLPLIREQLAAANVIVPETDDDKICRLIELYKVRMKTLREFVDLTYSFFKDDFAFDEKGKKKYLDDGEKVKNVKTFADKLEVLGEFTHGNIEKVCRQIADEKGLKASDIIHPTRMAISGKMEGAGLFEMMEVLGKNKVLERMRKV